MFEKHLWKSDILSKDAGHRPTTWFIHNWNIGWKCINIALWFPYKNVSKIGSLFSLGNNLWIQFNFGTQNVPLIYNLC